MLKKNLFFLLFLGLGFSLTAQQDDTQIITESGTPLEEIYIDGIVKGNSSMKLRYWSMML